MMMNRRNFLAAMLAGSVSAPFASRILAEEAVSVDPNHLVLLSDTHCAPHLKHQLDFMRQSISEIVAMNPRPGHVLIYGDFAFLYGKLEDYKLLKELVAPLDAAGIPWTTCMGNHDRRENFTEVFPEHAEKSLMKDRLVFRVETENVDFLMLDSLIEPPETTRWITPGEILDDQRDFLNETLKASTKPVIVGAHHDLNETKIADILKANDCVAGYINGHHHYWTTYEKDGVKALILPSNGHWGDIGLVNATLSPKQAEFKLFMRDYLVLNKGPDYEPNQNRFKIVEAKQGAVWRLDL